MSYPDVVSRESWLAARIALLEREKELTRRRDTVNADRRRLPMVRIDKDYTFEGPDGMISLAELFDGSSQLVVRHAMFDPQWEKPCPGCNAAMSETSPALFTHLKSRDTSYATISRAPYSKLAAHKAKLGWTFGWYSSFGSDFNYDFGVSLDASVTPVGYNYRSHAELVATDPEWADIGSTEMPGFSCFLRDGDDVYHTYSTYARGTEQAEGGPYLLLDLTALGRQEDWEEPKGRAPSARPADPSFA